MFYRKGRGGGAKIHSATALKARPVTAMGATHGFKNPHDSPSRLQLPSGKKRQMREYGDILIELQLTFGVFFELHRH